MKKMKKDEPYFQNFKDFLKSFVAGDHKSYVLKCHTDSDVTGEAINRVYEIFCKALNKDNKDKKFDDVIKDIHDEKELCVLNHAIWLWGYPNNRKPKWVVNVKDSKESGDKYKNMPKEFVAGAGSGYVQRKTKGIRFILYIFTQIFDKPSIDEAVQIIKDICICKVVVENKTSYEVYYGGGKEDMPDGVKNLLLHLCDPDYYEPIASTSDKKKIVKKFGNSKNNDIDAELKSIRQNLDLKDASFYSQNLPLLWKGEGNGSGLSRVQLLEYKKAMVLYGPPGTGKTYTANELARELLIRDAFRKGKNKTDKDKNTKVDFAEITNNQYNSNIYYFQFHINYNYEDFIAGQVIDKDKGVVTKKGVIFDIISKANQAPDTPFVVILDEMNRVDISRVFGELFTAIEKRGTNVNLTLPDPCNKYTRLVLNVPENIYFIGTMNEIDFSLEQIDFALRRRFIWDLADYDEDALESVIENNYKSYLDKAKSIGEKDNEKLKNDFPDQSDFIECCTNVNKGIEGKLGKEYHIGHAFFAEIGKIAANLQINGISGDKWKKAKNILWEISIKPTLDAYCGTMDKDEKKGFIEKCDKAYKEKDDQVADTQNQQ